MRRLPAGLARLARLALAALAAWTVGGCGEDAPPPPVAPPPPPEIVALSPAPRSVRQAADVVSWAEFDAPLDAATVNDHTVFLMLDTRRVRIEVRWEAATSRIVIRPLEELMLGRTHTVQLSTAIHREDGTPLASVFEWQFRVIGVRAPAPVYPPPGAASESPFTSPDWLATETTAGDIRYEFYAGTDSAAVADRLVAPLRTHAYPLYLPETAWTPGSRVWWSVTTENRTLGERIDGPVSRFDVLPASARIDSVANVLSRYGWGFTTGASGCNQGLPVGSGYTSGIVWSPSLFGGPRKLADAWVETGSSNTSAVPRIYGAAQAFNECSMRYPGPPFTDPAMPVLAAAEDAQGVRRIRFRSDALTARIERSLRGASAPGFLFTSGLQTSLTGTVPMSMRLYYHVLPTSAAAGGPSIVATRRPGRNQGESR